METTLLRVAQRRGDASDATGDIVSAQAKVPSGALAWHKLDTGDNLEVVQARLLAIVQQSNLPAIN
jgi:predicted kinase